jgi:BlaI family penicillinase repressor
MLPRPTDAELEILAILWNRGPSTVRDVHDEVARARPAQYTTVLMLMQIMAEKKLVVRDEKQRAHIYSASKPREWTQRQIAGDLLQRAFGGSARSMLMGALSARRTSIKELGEIRKLLSEYEAEHQEAKHQEAKHQKEMK